MLDSYKVLEFPRILNSIASVPYRDCEEESITIRNV